MGLIKILAAINFSNKRSTASKLSICIILIGERASEVSNPVGILALNQFIFSCNSFCLLDKSLVPIILTIVSKSFGGRAVVYIKGREKLIRYSVKSFDPSTEAP